MLTLMVPVLLVVWISPPRYTFAPSEPASGRNSAEEKTDGVPPVSAWMVTVEPPLQSKITDRAVALEVMPRSSSSSLSTEKSVVVLESSVTGPMKRM